MLFETRSTELIDDFATEVTMTRLKALGITLGLLFSVSAFSDDALPRCLKGNQNVPINNAQIHKWKTTTANQFLARGHAYGRLTKVYPTKNGHAHFQIEFDDVADTLEVVYSLDFGKLPKLAKGMEIEACGDYITSTKATSQYPPSPDGAILHWIHRSTGGNHPSGYLAIDGRVYGQGG
jgi:hypothetical protein